MAKHSQLRLPPVEVTSSQKGYDRRSDFGKTGGKTEEEWRELLIKARDRSGYSHKAMAADMGITHPLLSAQLNGEPKNHVSFNRMFGLSREFWQEMVELIIEFHGLSVGADPKTQQYAEIGRRVCEVMALSDAVRRA